MSDYEQVDEVVSHGGAKGGRPGRNVVNESITLGDRDATQDRGDSGRGVEDDRVTLNGRAGRAMKASTVKMLANIDKHGTVDEGEESIEGSAVVVEPAKPAEVTTPPAAAAAVTTPAVADTVDPTIEFRTANERLSTRNRELVAENEKLKGGGARREPSAREKALDEIERMYAEDSVGAIRRLQALALGIDDHASKDVDAELSGLYQDLTARELGVSLDDTAQAKREAMRTRQILARDKRERKAETEAAAKPVEDPEATQTAQMHTIIGNELSLKRADGKSIAERFPLLTAFAADLEGSKPEALLWTGIKRAIQAGELDPNAPNDKLLEAVASQIETRYQALADKLVEARKPSTAQPIPATDAKDNQAQGQGHGTRTITNASASVAPATPPAKKPEPKVEDKPKWKNEKERRRELARRHAGEA